MKKSSVIYLIVSILLLLSIPISIVSFGFACPSQFDETYYGELGYMFKRLKKTKEPKVVLVGNSALAFGARSDLMTKELNMPIVTFGLYGAIGTKAMMDLSKVNINKDDIVILMPEISEQGLSLFFSAENMWQAIDGNYEMLNYIAKENRQTMVGQFASFASKKFNYLLEGHKPIVNGVYTQNSFDLDNQEVGYMTYERPYNIMLGGMDENAPIKFDKNYLGSDFIDYVNDYARYVYNRGAKAYFGFVPMNGLSITSSIEEIDDFYDYLYNSIDMPIVGNPHKYIMDYEWFYDNNSHLNSAGMYLFTKQIIEDIKIIKEDISPTNIEIPDKPTIPIPDYEGGDNTYEDCFEYEEIENGYVITKINEKGLALSSIIIPSSHNEKPILAFRQDVFANNKTISEIIIPKTIQTLFDHSFVGCDKLIRLVLQHDNPNMINVGMGLLDKADNCYVYIKEAYYDNFANHYNWGYYRNKLRKY